MKPEIAKIEIINRKNYTEAFSIVLNDPDASFMVNEELVVVNALALKTIEQTGWWRYLESLRVLNPAGVKQVDESNCFELAPGETGNIHLYYYSERKFFDESVDPK